MMEFMFSNAAGKHLRVTASVDDMKIQAAKSDSKNPTHLTDRNHKGWKRKKTMS